MRHRTACGLDFESLSGSKSCKQLFQLARSWSSNRFGSVNIHRNGKRIHCWTSQTVAPVIQSVTKWNIAQQGRATNGSGFMITAGCRLPAASFFPSVAMCVHQTAFSPGFHRIYTPESFSFHATHARYAVKPKKYRCFSNTL